MKSLAPCLDAVGSGEFQAPCSGPWSVTSQLMMSIALSEGSYLVAVPFESS